MMIYTHIHAYYYCLLNDMKSSRLSHQHLIYDRMSFAFLNWVILSDSNSHHHGLIGSCNQSSAEHAKS